MNFSSLLYLAVLTIFVVNGHAADLGFRFVNGVCQNQSGQRGLNPSYLGQCSDLRGNSLGNLNLEDMDFSGSQFSGANLRNLSLKNSIFDGANFEGATLNDVNLEHAKFKKSNLNRSVFKNVRMIGSEIIESQLKGTDFRTSNLQESTFESCEAPEANLSGVQLNHGKIVKSNFANANFIRANLSNSILALSTFTSSNFKEALFNFADLSFAVFDKSNLKNSIMSGATYNESTFKDATFSAQTVLPFSIETAKSLGMLLVRSELVLILWDELNDYVRNFADGIEAQSHGELTVTMSTFRESELNGQIDLAAFDSIIHFAGKNNSDDSPEISPLGQRSLVEFVKKGGNFIYGEWMAFGVMNGKYKAMLDLILLQREAGNRSKSELTMTTEGINHPITAEFNGKISIGSSGQNIGPSVQFEKNPVQVLAIDESGSAAVGLRKLEKGNIVAFNFACTYDDSKCLDESSVRQLYINAILNH